MRKSYSLHEEFWNRKRYNFHFLNYLTLWPGIFRLYLKNLRILEKMLLILIIVLTCNLHTRCIRLYDMAFMTRLNSSLRLWRPFHVQYIIFWAPWALGQRIFYLNTSKKELSRLYLQHLISYSSVLCPHE